MAGKIECLICRSFRGHPDNVPGLAAESLLIKIGENVARLSPRLIDAYPDVPWSLIKRMRDRLAHRYEATDYAIVWATLVSDLPEIATHVRGVLGIAGVSRAAVARNVES